MAAAPTPEPTPEPSVERPPAPGPKPSAVLGVRNYRPAQSRKPRGGTSLVTLMLVTTTPAVLAAAMLRPRSQSTASRRGRG
ncbi:hypothetical protein AB0M39_27775 [Streptomyces sp. NPDC051907]|uniref:hypothetical protein n=1 Tax=Streptomyces sp. NPDC051907 TaxID=3155284 RepID=UPI00342868F6